MKITLTKLLVVACMATLAACGSDDSDTETSGGAGGAGGSAGKESKESEDGPAREAKVLDSSTKKGDFPATLASAAIEDPGEIKVKITPTPARATEVSWTVACRKGRKAGTKDGQFRVTKTTTKRLRRPLTRSDICNVSASAQLSTPGTIKVEIIG